MSELRQRIDPIRSAAIRDSARGAPCMLEFPSICNHNPETTVWAHWRDESFGRGRKAHDTSGFPACSSCHAFLDVGWPGKMSLALMRFYVIRAMQRAFVHLIDCGAVTIKQDVRKPLADKPIKPRKPREERAKVSPGRPLQSRNDWPAPGTRKLRSRPMRATETETLE